MSASEASPRPKGKLFGRPLSYGTPQQTRPGAVLFRPGDGAVDLVVVAGDLVEVIRVRTAALPAEFTTMVGPGGFIGEPYLVTGHSVSLQRHVREAGAVYRASPGRSGI